MLNLKRHKGFSKECLECSFESSLLTCFVFHVCCLCFCSWIPGIFPSCTVPVVVVVVVVVAVAVAVVVLAGLIHPPVLYSPSFGGFCCRGAPKWCIWAHPWKPIMLDQSIYINLKAHNFSPTYSLHV